MILTSCGDWRQTRQGVLVGHTKLEVIDTNIIRVISSSKQISRDRNLVEGYSYPSEKFWTVSEYGTDVILATPVIRAIIDKSSGKVRFEDASGNTVLAEDGRVFDGHPRQKWVKNEGETFYMFRCFDREDTFPYVASDRNYGVFWDIGKDVSWQIPQERMQLNELFRVYDITGAEGGLTGTYFYEMNGSSQKLVRPEPFIYYNDDDAVAEFKPDIPLDGSRVTFEGDLEPLSDGVYDFELRFTGGMDLYVDGDRVIADKWRAKESPAEMNFSCSMKAGDKTHLRIEWNPDAGLPYCSLTVVPSAFADEKCSNSFWGSEGDRIDYYFVYGESIDVLAEGLVSLVYVESGPSGGLYCFPVMSTDKKGVSIKTDKILSIKESTDSRVADVSVFGGMDGRFILLDNYDDAGMKAAAEMLYNDSSSDISFSTYGGRYPGFDVERIFNITCVDTAGVKSYSIVCSGDGIRSDQ